MPAAPTAELTQPDLLLSDGRVSLRPLRQEDATPRYVAWLNDPEVNRWLETRWVEQDIDMVRAFIAECNRTDGVHLWGIFDPEAKHIGNIKLGPVNQRHSYADVSYFIGDRSQWGKGYATAAVKLVTEFAFKKLRLHRVQAGCYGGNKGSARVLRKAGFSSEAQMNRQLRTENGWDDHLWFGRLHETVVL